MKSRARKHQFVVGIDEAGRGPIAGPVSVGAAIALGAAGVLNKLIKAGERATGTKLKDSKGLSPAARERWYAWMLERRAARELSFAVGLTSSKAIDSKGIVPAVTSAMSSALKRVTKHACAATSDCYVMLDGGLKAPVQYESQITIIKGDASEAIIALASIAAKVERDRYMRRIARIYPSYSFDIHKGYGTRAHYKSIAANGLCVEHRKSFLKRLTAK